jgi:hypothetical protein
MDRRWSVVGAMRRRGIGTGGVGGGDGVGEGTDEGKEGEVSEGGT